MKRALKTWLRLTTALAAGGGFCIGAPAHAQTAETATQLDELVVTAQKREERLLDVPVSVAVVQAETLTAYGQNESVDLAYRVPNLGVSNSAGPRSFGFFIRGIGTTSFASESIESSSAYVVDGVVLGQAGASLTDLPDIERVEVLRGPQGTLFGKNASAGVINVVTRRPSEAFTVEGKVSWAWPDNDRKASVLVSGPISDQVRYAVSGRINKRDGFMKNLFDGRELNDRNDWGLRGKLEVTPSDNLTLSIIGDYWRRDANCCMWTIVQTGTPIDPREQAILNYGVQLGEGRDYSNIDGDVYSDVKTSGVSAQADYDFGDGFTFTSISAWRYWRTIDGLDSDNAPVNQTNKNDADFRQTQFTQEFRIASPKGPFLDYVAGFFYFNSDVHSESTQLRPLERTLFRNLVADNYTTSENIAVFGQANLNFTDDFRLIVGGRYLQERSEAEKIRLDPVNNHTERNQAAKTDHAFLWRLGAQYDLTDTSNVFATVTRGYKGGGYDVGIATTTLLDVRPEQPTNYEVGLRAAFPAQNLLFNVTAFWLEVEDLQVTAREPGDIGLFLLLNAAEARSRGVEAEGFWRPFDDMDLTLSGSLAYTDGKYKSFPRAPCYRGQTAATGCVGGVQDLSGAQLPFAPKWSWNLDVNYVRPVGAGLSLYLNGNINHRTDFPANTPNSPFAQHPAFTLINAAVGVGPEDGRWKVSVFGRNLTDEFYYTRKFSTPGIAGLGALSLYHPYEAQRIVGVSLDVKY
ncbi:TonB-dependent receptor [Phenylobacterium terrae]|uniref:TonB-dependent receptor n=1 Tax=Phenylobacterium terrae TaxID=2665495 RepID=A0ABW4N620_9CAUL